MKVIFLQDVSDATIDAVIITKTSSKEDVQKAINKAREIEYYNMDDVVQALPKDCEVYDRWSNEIVYY